MLVGVIMFVYGTSVSFGLVTLIIDDTPPELTPMFPTSGQTVTACGYIGVAVADPESGVVSVTARLDTTDYILSLFTGNKYSGFWKASVTPILYTGTHTLHVVATNDVDRQTDFSITFTVYSGLQGKWYINHIEITSVSQVIKLNTLTLNFKFGRTAGTDPLTCTISWSGPETGSMGLTETTANTWTGTHVFGQGGTYDMTLTADDGTEQVTMNVFGVELPGDGAWVWPTIDLNMWQWAGLALMGVGSIFTWKGKSKQEA